MSKMHTFDSNVQLEKIGKADAERDFHEKLVPAIKSRPDIFPSETLDKWYTVERYHIMGSRILSRSFHVETGVDHNSVGGGEFTEANTGSHSAMDVDRVEKLEEQEEDDSDDEDEDTSGITMVPMADLLNARYGCNNVSSRASILLHINNSVRLGYLMKILQPSRWSQQNP